MDRFITIKQFCERFNVSRSTVYRENKAGRLPFVKVGRATRIRESVSNVWPESLAASGRL